MPPNCHAPERMTLVRARMDCDQRHRCPSGPGAHMEDEAVITGRNPMSDLSYGRDRLGDVEAATRLEWLVTNGIGGFASGTVSGALTRRYHGLLVASLKPPVGRTLLLAKLAESLEVDGAWVDLDANRWAGGTISPGRAPAPRVLPARRDRAGVDLGHRRHAPREARVDGARREHHLRRVPAGLGQRPGAALPAGAGQPPRRPRDHLERHLDGARRARPRAASASRPGTAPPRCGCSPPGPRCGR